MKKTLFAAVFGVVVLGALSAASAQSPTHVKVAFPFVVSGTLLPAGEYEVVPVDSAMTTVVKIMKLDGKAEAFATTTWGDEVAPNAKASFDFKKFGGEYFLWRIKVPGESAREVRLDGSVVAHDLVKLALNRDAASHKTGAVETGDPGSR